MSDIVERMRAAARHPYMDNTCKVRTYDALEAAAEIEKLRSDVRTAVFADSAELKDVKRYNEELRGLLREAWVKMEANDLWSNLRARVAAALKETGDE